jgi:uncharacterized protein (TIGR03435 family)
MAGRNAFIVLSVVAGLLAPLGPVQSATTPKFEVASIRTCRAGDIAPAAGTKSGRGGAGRVSGSPGRLSVECRTVASLIRDAYLSYTSGEAWPQPVGSLTPAAPVSDRLRGQEIKGSPAWVNADRYTIEAKAEGAQSIEMMRGPMMQGLLEDRFRLKMHREVREIPVYELTVDKGGPKLKATQDGGCIVIRRGQAPPEPTSGEPFPRICGGFLGDDLKGSTMANLCRQFSVMMDRDVIDKTGIPGVFDIHLESFFENARPSGPAGGAPGLSNPPGPQIPPDPTDVFAAARIALKKLGLKLEPAKGSGEFLVIDHVEKPSEN